MKFDKMEEKFRKELNNRLIKPSENSWDRLDVMLTIAEEKKSKPKFLWIYVAAITIGLLLTATLVFNQFNYHSIEPINNVVIEQKSNPIKNEDAIKNLDNIKTDVNILNEKLIASETKSLKSIPETPSEKTTKESSNEIKISTEIKGEVLMAINQKIEEKSVDELLASVQITSSQGSKNSSIKVNAQRLLHQVDDNSTLTFKEKAIVTIAENYKNIQTAIVNRNQ